ncbi:hypothetical protein [Pseudorhodoplanes sp.]|uniref:hypothetical protein n=1 Tax=Pseudorhodoplanes sp. TaxID=1934341 RepID=UPI003919A35D
MFVYEKVVVAIVVAVVSGLLLYAYNLHSKAFEIAQVQARGHSLTAQKLRELALNGALKATLDIRIAHNSGIDKLPKSIEDSVEVVAIELTAVSKLIAAQLKDAAPIAEEMGRELKTHALKFGVGLEFDRDSIEKFESRMNELQLKFIAVFDREIGPLAVSDLDFFHSSFEQVMPIYLRPKYVMLICLAIFLVATLGLVILWYVDRRTQHAAES